MLGLRQIPVGAFCAGKSRPMPSFASTVTVQTALKTKMMFGDDSTINDELPESELDERAVYVPAGT